MKIDEQYLTVNEYSRPGKPLGRVLAVVMHWTANPSAGAAANRDFFETRKNGMAGYGSAHYIVGQNGDIVRCIPEEEVAFHCGTDIADPASGKVYTDYAREKFGAFASGNSSPNLCTIGVELCPVNWDGYFSADTLNAAAELVAGICVRHGLSAGDVTTHHDVVGWKDCPRLWTNNPKYLEEFRDMVRGKMMEDGT